MSYAKSQTLDFEQIGDCTLYFGDCLDVMPTLSPVDMVLTDIPYHEVNQKSSGLRNLDKGKADEKGLDIPTTIQHLINLTTGSIYVFCGTMQISLIVELMRKNGLTVRVGAWNKTNPSPMNGSRLWLSGLEFCVFGRRAKATFNEHCKKAIWDNPSGRNKSHPTEKPLPLFSRLIEASSNSGDVVLDCCMGSGTTGVACVNTGRKFIGIELDAGYFDIACDQVEAAL